MKQKAFSSLSTVFFLFLLVFLPLLFFLPFSLSFHLWCRLCQEDDEDEEDYAEEDEEGEWSIMRFLFESVSFALCLLWLFGSVSIDDVVAVQGQKRKRDVDDEGEDDVDEEDD